MFQYVASPIASYIGIHKDRVLKITCYLAASRRRLNPLNLQYNNERGVMIQSCTCHGIIIAILQYIHTNAKHPLNVTPLSVIELKHRREHWRVLFLQSRRIEPRPHQCRVS